MTNKFSPMDGYDDFLRELKERIRSAQIKAALSVNRELVLLYWQIGQEILTRQQQQGWGAKVIERLAKDLKGAFPDMKGFSRTNLLCVTSTPAVINNELVLIMNSNRGKGGESNRRMWKRRM